jgi:hypothetical protein
MKFRLTVLCLALPGIIAAQAAVETAVGAGRAATMTAPAQKAGKGIAGAFDNLNRTLHSQGNSNSTTGSSSPSSQPSSNTKTAAVNRESGSGVADPKTAISYENPSSIQTGMDGAEVEHRFGPPSMKITTSPGEELLYYTTKDARINVTVRDGKVAVVDK